MNHSAPRGDREVAGIAFTADPKDPRSLSARFRARRNIFLRSFIDRVRKGKSGSFHILDIGGRPDYWDKVGRNFLNSRDLRITCVNLEASELAGDASERLTLAVGNACALDYPDDSFDLVHSNSVIEHVGRFADMTNFARETRRLAPAYYVQTPYFWFPIDPHFYRLPAIHWMPTSLQIVFLKRFQLGHSAPSRDLAETMRKIESRSILDAEMFRHLFPDAEHRFERAFGLPKSMIACRTSRQTVDFVPAPEQ
jgi:hypothetical protein